MNRNYYDTIFYIYPMSFLLQFFNMIVEPNFISHFYSLRITKKISISPLLYSGIYTLHLQLLLNPNPIIMLLTLNIHKFEYITKVQEED